MLDGRRRVGRGILSGAFAVAVGAAAFLAETGSAASIEQARLTASDAADGDFFGVGGAVALSGDSAIVGAYGKNSAQGAAYVFTRAGAAWAQQAKLVASDAADGDDFGRAVALSADTAVVGAPARNSRQGAAYVFARVGATWTQQAALTASDAADDSVFGGALALDGDTLVVGAKGGNAGRGAAYVFTRSGATWTQQAELTAGDAANVDAFGGAVALSADTAVVGAPQKSVNQGAAYVFTRAGAAWTQQAKLTEEADAANGDFFGTSVAASGDAALVGAYGEDVGHGAAYVFARAGATWTRQATLAATDAAAGDRFGGAVALDGEAAVVGAYGKESLQGAAYVFSRDGSTSTWSQQAKLAETDGANGDQFGGSVATSGGTTLVGAGGRNALQGAAYVFVAESAPPPSAGCLLATKVKAARDAKRPARSTITASGILDTGPGAPDLEGPATFDLGGFHLDVPAFVAKGRSLTYAARGITLTITPAKNGSSRATFGARAVGDFSGKIDVNAPLTIRFADAAHDLSGTATLTAGVLGPHAVTSPTLCGLKAAATIKGAGKDALALTLCFATDGAAPVAAEDLTITFGGTYSTTLPAAGFVRKRAAWVHAGKAPGITKATVDYSKGTITIAASGVDLGAFAAGGDAVTVTVARGADVRSVTIRMALARTKLSY